MQLECFEGLLCPGKGWKTHASPYLGKMCSCTPTRVQPRLGRHLQSRKNRGQREHQEIYIESSIEGSAVPVISHTLVEVLRDVFITKR
jgi:hypothetical protein